MSSAVETFEIPLDLVEQSPGFSLDIGASAGKLIYRSNEEFKDGKPLHAENKTTGSVHMITFNQNDVDTAIGVVKQRCDVTWKEGDPPIKVTGVGCNLHKTKIEQGLGVKIENMDEFDCLVAGLMALKKSDSQDLFYPLPQEALESGRRSLALIKSWRKRKQTESSRVKFPPLREEFDPQTGNSIKLPCLMVVCGSVCVIIKIEESGKFVFTDHQLLAGKFFLALSTLLLGKKPFDELIDEVSAADGETCDYFMTDERGTDGQTTDDVCAALAEAKCAERFALCKVVEAPRESIKDSDVAMSMLQNVTELIGQTTVLTAGVSDTPQVYFVGNFAGIPEVRYSMTKYLCSKVASGETKELLDFQFVKLGGQIGSLGAFISSKK